MTINFHFLSDKFSQAATFINSSFNTVQQTITSTDFPKLGAHVFEQVAQKANQVWISAKPFIDPAIEFAQTSLGKASLLMGGAAGCAILSRTSSNEAVSSLALLSSIIMAVGAGVYLSQSGVIPPSVISRLFV